MMKFRYLILIGILGITINSCDTGELNLVIDDEIQPYLDLFVEEADQRGVAINVQQAQLTASITTINRAHVAGQCTQGGGTVSQVLIDESVWKSYSILEREALVFHELGHCLLKRGHRDDQDGNGNCLSLMESGASGCELNYTTETRKTLIDELFQ